MQGESLSPLSPIAFHYTRNFRPGQSLIVTDDLIACDGQCLYTDDGSERGAEELVYEIDYHEGRGV
jgi:hypothetical protein